MTRILSADIYRLRKQKSTWILPAATFLISLMLACLYGLIYGNAPWLVEFHNGIKESITAASDNTGMASFESIRQVFDVKFPSVAEYIVSTMQRESVVSLVLFVSVYSAAVRRNGFHKNVPGVYNSFGYNVSQSIVILVFSFVITAANLLGMLASVGIFFADMPFGNALSLIGFSLVTALLHWALSLMVVLLCDTMKNATVGVVIGCLYTGAVASLLVPAVDLLFNSVLGLSFKLSFVLPYSYSIILKYDDLKSYLYACVLSLLYAAVFFLVKLLIRKKDIA